MYSRSRKLALFGLPVVVVAVALVALSADPTDPTPKGTYAVIFAIIGAFVFALLGVQQLDMRDASRALSEPSIAPGTPVENPMTATQVDLWASLATGPIGDEAARAHDAAWGLARRSHSTGWIICALIFITVPMTYLLETFIPVLIGAALIVLVALAYLARLFGGGEGESLDGAYEAAGAAAGPLGLELVERPEVGVGTYAVEPYGLKSEVRGALRFSGQRHGRQVDVTLDDGGCEVRVAGSTTVPPSRPRPATARSAASAGASCRPRSRRACARSPHPPLGRERPRTRTPTASSSARSRSRSRAGCRAC